MKNRLILPLLLLSLTVGCVAQKKTGSSGSSYGETLSEQVARHDQQISQMLSQMGQVEQVLPSQAEMWSQVQTMREDLNMLHGQIADVNNQMMGAGVSEVSILKERVNRLETILRRMGSQLAIDTDELDAPLPTLADPNATTGTQQTGMAGTQHMGTVPPITTTPTNTDPTMQGQVQTTMPQATPQTSGDTATNLYQSGIKLFDQRKYKEAVISFKDFASTYPTHNLAGNAHFWQGESYYQMEDYARAALAYQEVITKYPGSHQMPASMLKQGISLYKVNKKAAGKERLEELVKKYPTSPEASRAKRYIKENP